MISGTQCRVLPLGGCIDCGEWREGILPILIIVIYIGHSDLGYFGLWYDQVNRLTLHGLVSAYGVSNDLWFGKERQPSILSGDKALFR